MKDMTSEQCAEQVRRMARRTALLYYHFAITIIDEFGEEKGRALVSKAIWRYGEQIGRSVARRVSDQGLSLITENYNQAPDLPTTGWETGSVQTADGETHTTVTYCPLAEVFRELGEEQLGRLYCYVDQAKQQGYNPDYEYLHLKNILDGDPICEFAVRKSH